MRAALGTGKSLSFVRQLYGSLYCGCLFIPREERRVMNKYRVTLKYGDPGKYKHNSQSVTVEAESDSTAMRLAESKFKNSNSTYKNKEVDIVKVEKI
jgi:hypothetical protein